MNDCAARFIVVGGCAVAFHRPVRRPVDIDLWIERSDENADYVIRALGLLGVTVPFNAAELMLPKKLLRLTKANYNVDVLTSVGSLEFVDAWERGIAGTIGNVPVVFPSMVDLIAMKTESAANEHGVGREKDLADLRLLETSDKAEI